MHIHNFIMRLILDTVLFQDDSIRRVTSSYIDDVCINENMVSTEWARNHLPYLDLLAPREAGSKLLGLQVWWELRSKVPELLSSITCRSIFSLHGKLVSHFLFCGWLRIVTAFLKQSTPMRLD